MEILLYVPVKSLILDYRKMLDIYKIKLLGWEARTDLIRGIEKTYTWYTKKYTQSGAC